jgi:4-aminobutyrate aminotransferase/(S)-3-amino-2-methylpropionate transaminase
MCHHHCFQGPGCPKLSILSFEGAFHGRAIAALSCTHSKVIHKLDIPVFDWPIAPFPQLRYPLEQYREENKAEEQRCLKEVRYGAIDSSTLVYVVHNVQLDEHFLSALERDCPVAAAIVEPIQAEGGECTGGVNVDRPHPLLHVQVTDMRHQSISEVCSQYVRRWVLGSGCLCGECVCMQHGASLIVDEVQTGGGVTGTMW